MKKGSEAAPAVTPMMVDLALDAWSGSDTWRKSYLAARMRRDMRKALIAALEWRNAPVAVDPPASGAN